MCLFEQELTPRQEEVFALLAEGKQNRRSPGSFT
jgi:DNA-binding NarL/FixJ family response regulator